MKKILILGGGFGGVEVFSRLHKHFHPPNPENVKVELISRTNYFTFSPMLHEVATGSVTREDAVQPLREILSCCGKDFHQSVIQNIDPKNKTVTTDKGTHMYDILVIAMGAEQGFFGVPGAAEHALALKWLPGAIDIRNRIINSFEMASEMHDRNDIEAMKRFLRFVIVGGGATGTELAGQIADLVSKEIRYFYGDVPLEMHELVLIHSGDRILEQLSPRASAAAQKQLEKLRVQTLLNTTAVKVTDTGVTLKSGQTLESNSVFWTAGTESTLPGVLAPEFLTERGLLRIAPTFQVPGYDDVFAVGDCTVIEDASLRYPPTAQAAVQAANVAAHNIVALVKGKPMKTKKYTHKGDILPVGNWFAVFERKPFYMSGRLMWLLRRMVFLQTMYGWGNRIRVAFAWILAIFSPRDTSEF